MLRALLVVLSYTWSKSAMIIISAMHLEADSMPLPDALKSTLWEEQEPPPRRPTASLAFTRFVGIKTQPQVLQY